MALEHGSSDRDDNADERREPTGWDDRDRECRRGMDQSNGPRRTSGPIATWPASAGAPRLDRDQHRSRPGYPAAQIRGGARTGTPSPTWFETTGRGNNIWANRYLTGAGWGTATLIETDTGDASAPSIAVDASGNAIAVWHQSDGTARNMWRSLVAGTGWRPPGMIRLTTPGTAFSPSDVAFDDAGNAVAVWAQSDGTRTISGRTDMSLASGWGVATLIETGQHRNGQFLLRSRSTDWQRDRCLGSVRMALD